MSQNGSFSIGIGANTVDATKKLTALNKQLAQLQKPARDFAKAQARFNDLSGITKARADIAKASDNLRSMGRQALGAADSLTKIVAPLGLISGAASLAGMYRLVSAWGDFGTQIQNTSQRLNMTAQSLMSWQNGARLAGTSADAMTSGLKNLGDTMQDAIAGRAPEAAMMFQAMGVDIRKMGLEAKSAEEVLPQLADKIASIRNPTIQAQLATKLFGGAAEAMLPFLKKGSAGIDEYRAMAVKYGVINNEAAKAADNFRFSQTKLTLSVEGLGNSIAEKVAPVISPLLNNMSEWISLNREWIAGKIGYYVQQLADWIKTINWGDVFNGMKEWVKWGADLVNNLGGIKRVSEDLFIIWGVSKVAGLVGNLASIALGFTKIASAARMANLAAGETGLLGSMLRLSPLLLPLALSGDTAQNPEAQDAQRAQVARETEEYRRTHGGQTATPSGYTASGNLSPQARGLLDTIASGESTSYADIYGGGKITDFSKHPGISVPITSGPNAGLTSSAAGRYQFLQSTWNSEAAKLGLRDFSPASQDAAAWDLAQTTYQSKFPGRDLNADLKSSDPNVRANVGRALSSIWTSLPGGIESHTSGGRFTGALDANIASESGRGDLVLPTIPVGSPTTATEMTHRVDGNISANININGAPAGTTYSSTSSGSGMGGAPRVSIAMPSYPSP